ncbi:DUF2510 domain-containing protein [Cellulomonas sp. ACRRI]|uniref:DUF2510 domain-containing protein n=1 Tax=Cellulomonas sp. ACRRI TaxID=2918188 RepID=UPI001EF33B50|nr:DUF2510 domain-containing protein [Cellulomonas sp. ACRRI]MCG7284842.1 DUF2510 domain-containing protein [Cellulomonas sp. ACRRI]
MTEALPLPPAGWYPDGVTPGVLRWFDGAGWTEHTAPDPAARVPAPAPAPVAEPVPDAPAHRPPGTHAAAAAGAPAHARLPGTAGTAAGPGALVGASSVTNPYAPQPAVGAVATGGAYAPGHAHAAAPGGPWYPEPERARLGAGPRDPVHWLLPTGRSWQSIVAGYVGLVSLLIWPLGPVAIGFGLWAVRRGAAGGHGRGRAVFAVVVGTAATGLLTFLLASGALTV